MTSDEKKLLKILVQVQPDESHPIEYDVRKINGESKAVFQASDHTGKERTDYSPFDKVKTLEVIRDLADDSLLTVSPELDRPVPHKILVRHRGYHTGELSRQEAWRSFKNSVLAPVAVSVITTLLTLLIKWLISGCL